MKPIIFCDFDGVINQFPYRWVKESDGSHDKEVEYGGHTNYGFFHKDFNDEKFFRADEFTMMPTHKGTFALSYSSEMVDRLRKLIVDDLVHFVWLTTWRAEAVSLLNPLFNFPEHVNYLEWSNKMSDHNHAFKGYAIFDYFDEHPDERERKIVWLDDVATRGYANWREGEGFGSASLEAADNLPDNRLVLLTDGLYGISRAEMNMIEEFVR